MPLETPYGVNVGPLHDADLVNPDTGQWPHYHVRISGLNGQIMDSAINLKSLTDIQIEYRSRQFGIQEPLFASVVELPDGQHLLAQTSSSGALDYVRHGGITGTADWTLQTGDNLIDKLNALLSGVERLYIFGATYSSGIGVHDVHMNQGDPDGSSFQHLDGIWQDGGVLFQYGGSQPRLEVLQIKFETQSLFTDDHGLPVHFRIPPRLYYIPRWRWPPGDPMTNDERRVLLESGLIKIASWAAVINEVPGEARAAMTRELHTQLGRHLPEASKEHLGRIASYVVKMGQRFRQLGL